MELAFIQIEKSAGKTVARIMRRKYGTAHCDASSWSRAPQLSDSDLDKVQALYPNLESKAGHSVRPYGLSQARRDEFNFYTMLRNPVERCAAHYDYQVTVKKRSLSLSQWLDDEAYRNRQTKYLAGKEDLASALGVLDSLFFVGITEKLHESMVLLGAKLSIDTRFPEYQESPTTRLGSELLHNPESRALLESAN